MEKQYDPKYVQILAKSKTPFEVGHYRLIFSINCTFIGYSNCFEQNIHICLNDVCNINSTQDSY